MVTRFVKSVSTVSTHSQKEEEFRERRMFPRCVPSPVVIMTTLHVGTEISRPSSRLVTFLSVVVTKDVMLN